MRVRATPYPLFHNSKTCYDGSALNVSYLKWEFMNQRRPWKRKSHQLYTKRAEPMFSLTQLVFVLRSSFITDSGYHWPNRITEPIQFVQLMANRLSVTVPKAGEKLWYVSNAFGNPHRSLSRSPYLTDACIVFASCPSCFTGFSSKWTGWLYRKTSSSMLTKLRFFREWFFTITYTVFLSRNKAER